MKKFTTILTVLIAMTIKTNAQIPNGGFEVWTTQTGIEIPSAPWVTNNLQKKPDGVTYNPVTKSSDHYPVNVGSYSIRLENNISFISEPGEPLPYWACAYGYTATAFYPGYTGPTFPITGHPDSLCGYYKFLPQNNDTMSVSVVLYYQGTIVSSAFLHDTTTASVWSSFCVPIPTYTVADSAQIGFSAFYAGLGPEFPKGPYGNSIIYIDNLSFDTLITTSVNSEHVTIPAMFELGQNYPNPFNPITTIQISLPKSGIVQIKVHDILGTEIRNLLNEYKAAGTYNIEFDANSLSSGVYFYTLQAGNFAQTKKLLLLK